MQIYSTDGTESSLLYVNDAGDSVWSGQNLGGIVRIRGKNDAGDSKIMFEADPDGAADLYHAGVKTISTGVNSLLVGGTGTTLRLFNDGSAAEITNSGQGDHTVVTGKSTAGDPRTMIRCDPDEAVKLYHAGVANFWTTDEGAATRGGIKFPATQVASTDVNTLDDYQEGTWTPTVWDGSSGGTQGGTSVATGTYTKIGNIVTIKCNIDGITTGGMTAGNSLFIRGLPFTSAVSEQNVGSLWMNNVTFTGFCTPIVSASAGYMFIRDNISGSSASTVNISDLSSGNADIEITVTYFV
jgi:hypothetical protein